MHTRVRSLVVVVALALGSPAGAFAANITVRAALNAAHETPAPSHGVPRATGILTGTLTQTKAGYNFDWRLTYAKTSGKATFTNVQEGTATKHGTVILFLCGPCKTGAHGKTYASPGEVSLLMSGKLFVNLTTKQNPSGEIRGQLTKSG
jgi:hypothetical protein